MHGHMNAFLSIFRQPLHVSRVSKPIICCPGWIGIQSNQDNRQSSKKDNKYQLLYTYSCTSWWWVWIRPKHVEVDEMYWEIFAHQVGFSLHGLISFVSRSARWNLRTREYDVPHWGSDNGPQIIESILVFWTSWVVLILNKIRRFGSRLCSIFGLNVKKHPRLRAALSKWSTRLIDSFIFIWRRKQSRLTKRRSTLGINTMDRSTYKIRGISHRENPVMYYF
jgi:hypothetical protein